LDLGYLWNLVAISLLITAALSMSKIKVARIVFKTLFSTVAFLISVPIFINSLSIVFKSFVAIIINYLYFSENGTTEHRSFVEKN
jgi:hypothetical protein